MTTATANAPPASHEVGMMFVHEYYTFLNKEPSRLHCFYNKDSTMSHGTQGAEPHVSHGQQDIHDKIQNLDFEDCKVLVSNVDSQSSLDGGIMVQVLGEMSNRGRPSQTFVQTFFLAKQPLGFYVLNDIFRYLEDYEPEFDASLEDPTTDFDTEANTVDCEAVAPVAAEEATPAAPTSIDLIEPAEQVTIEVVAEAKAPQVEDKKNFDKKPEHKKHDKKADKKESKKEDAKETKKEVKKEIDAVEEPKTPEPPMSQSEPSEAETPIEVSAPTPAAVSIPTTVTPAASATPATPVTPAPANEPVPAPTALPAEQSKPKSWANLASQNSGQWGSHVAPGAKGSSVNVSQPSPKPHTQTPNNQTLNRSHGSRPHNGREDIHGIYAKNITEKMTKEQLLEAFNKFGPVKNIELTKKNGAYIDFDSAEAVRAALQQYRVSVGTETVIAEERRPRLYSSGRSSYNQNGNGPNGHQGPQGGHRGGRPSRGGHQERRPVPRHEKPAPAVAVN